MSVRRTKIVATLGPASNSPEVLEQLILAGIDVARLNFSHGTPDEHRARARLVRELAAKHGRFVALLGDLQGPKIRIAKFANKRIELQVGDKFRFSTSHARDAGTQEVVGIDYPDLVKDCGVGDELLLDDGRVVMVVEEVAADELRCRVLIGGPLSDHKGINRRGGGLTAPALTDKDKADIKLAADMDLDYVAVSFPRDAKDMEYARRNNKVVITATQMMESMIHSPMPTRAEVSDVANAVLDYTDAVMLSAESAAGEYPVEAVKAMARVCQGAEKHPTSQKSSHRLGQTFDRCDESIALASMYTANHFPGIKAIICLTESGFTPLIMSRIRSSVPIYAYSPHRETQARVAMFRGVETIPFDPAALPAEKVSQAAVDELLKRGVVTKGDWVILTKGDSYTAQGGTNTMKVLHVGDLLV
ncbi:pyruvate kinase [Pseudomonas aeruginosa]|uniref:pyruvate kinase n=1 Tax=Pseudomonas aeruginosa TaxID=287 RepID=UPI001247179D|nr:pyruvate kinase [Pseudomonas aeruginosa]KAB0733392.1 pyruvate kinase [Pseudomonas aeruginosa]MCW5436104.1 pyruvate kinase [Pseudomonas aeruginosa]